MKVLAIDIGSSSARVMLVDSSRDYHMDELYRISHTSTLDENGSYRWSIDNVFDNLKNAVDKATGEHEIESIGICSWGVDYGVISGDGSLVDSPYSYRDERTADIIANMPSNHAEYSLFERTGIYPNAINTIYQLLSDKKTGRYSDIKGVKIALIADLFAYYLTGKIRAELTNVSTTGLLSKNGLDWDFELIEELGLDSSIFPDVIHAGDVYGNYNGVAVTAVPTHDTASAIFAMGDMTDNTAFVSSGSWLLVGRVMQSPIISPEVYNIGYTNERVCDNKVSLLVNINGLYVVQRIVAEGGINYKDIDSAMESASVLGELDVDKLMSPDDMIGNIERMLQVTNADIMDIVKTAYYSLAIRLVRSLRDIAGVTGTDITKIILTGGATRAKYLLDTVREIGGLEIVLLAGEGAIKGNSMLQVRARTLYID